MKNIIRTFTLLFGISLFASSAFAAWTVFDPSAVAKLTAQISEIKKQIVEIQAIKNGVTDQIKAIGEVGKQVVPILNMVKLESQLKKTVQCTLLKKEDFESLFPSLEFEEYDVGSVCNADKVYLKALFPSKEDFSGSKKAIDQAEIAGRVRARRTVMVVDTSTKALGLADSKIQDSKEYMEAVIELEGAADTAEDSNARLAVIAKGQALIAKGIATTNQLLAMMLKQQTAHSIRELPLTAVEIEN